MYAIIIALLSGGQVSRDAFVRTVVGMLEERDAKIFALECQLAHKREVLAALATHHGQQDLIDVIEEDLRWQEE